MIHGTTSPGNPGTGESVSVDNAFHSFFSKTTVLNDISYIPANRQGPPSWVVRCLETGGIFPSQRQTAVGMDLPENELSQHLNGTIPHVRGYHFERICMAA